jgi:hypothetical protein
MGAKLPRFYKSNRTRTVSRELVAWLQPQSAILAADAEDCEAIHNLFRDD